jgi:hypothetical protein
MVIDPRSRPEVVDIPDSVWASDQLSPYLAGLAERYGPNLRVLPC